MDPHGGGGKHLGEKSIWGRKTFGGGKHLGGGKHWVRKSFGGKKAFKRPGGGKKSIGPGQPDTRGGCGVCRLGGGGGGNHWVKKFLREEISQQLRLNKSPVGRKWRKCNYEIFHV